MKKTYIIPVTTCYTLATTCALMDVSGTAPGGGSGSGGGSGLDGGGTGGSGEDMNPVKAGGSLWDDDL